MSDDDDDISIASENKMSTGCSESHSALSQFAEAARRIETKTVNANVFNFISCMFIVHPIPGKAETMKRRPKFSLSIELCAVKWMGGPPHTPPLFYSVSHDIFMTFYAKRTAR